MRSSASRNRPLSAAALAFATALWLCAPTGVASAQDQGARARAAEHYQRGVGHFRAKRYAQALDEYRAAYDLTGNPLLLFNIGLAHRANDDTAEALAAFRGFLAETPTGEISDEAREYVGELQAELDREREREKRREAAEAARLAAAAADNDRSERRPGSGLRITGIAVASVGAALLATGAVFGGRARSIHNELEQHMGGWTDADLARIDDGESAERNALLLGAAGGALLLAGGISYWLGQRAARRDAATALGPAAISPVVPTVVPAVVSDGQSRALGLSLSGSF